MRMISTKTNPAFKRVQLLPMLPSFSPPRTVGAAMGIAEFTPPQSDLRRKMTDLAVCALSASQGFNAPVVRLTS